MAELWALLSVALSALLFRLHVFTHNSIKPVLRRLSISAVAVLCGLRHFFSTSDPPHSLPLFLFFKHETLPSAPVIGLPFAAPPHRSRLPPHFTAGDALAESSDPVCVGGGGGGGRRLFFPRTTPARPLRLSPDGFATCASLQKNPKLP